MIREELIKAMAKHFRGNKDKFMKPTDWSAERDREDGDDDDDRLHLRFNHQSGDEVISSDLIITSIEYWKASERWKDEAWSTFREDGKMYALKILTHHGQAVPITVTNTDSDSPPPTVERSDRAPIKLPRAGFSAKELLQLCEKGHLYRGIKVTEHTAPSPLGGAPIRMVMIDATNNMWRWFVGSPYFACGWTIVKEGGGRTQAIQVQP
jgi:hypothetical protein